ncbi:MAG: UvrD-helicase domain-containing protein [Planctomycetaceae bacterium]|nr:UvrD-helicase domain-containing protein [Planctomycetaceae bacterium]
MDHYYWLTPETVQPQAEELINAVSEFISERKSLQITVQHADEAYAVIEGRKAATSIRSAWFFVSVGVTDFHDGSKETFYLSTSPNAYQFGTFNLVPWTNWLYDVVTRIREAAKLSQFPTQLEYGPPNNRKRMPVGPIVDYDFREGHLVGWELRFGSTAPKRHQLPASAKGAEPIPPAPKISDSEAPTAAASEPTLPAEPTRSFGLKEIIRTIDLDQNDRIRGPKSGVFILEGGPGVGKTTVALHRIPYLVNEQVEYDERGRRKNVDPQELFFQQSNMLVVVWKVHLVPYLRRCIEQLGMREFPEENVSHVDDWIERTLRRYVRIGPSQGSVRIRPEEPELSENKLKLTESDIDDFLTSVFPLKAESASNIESTVRHIQATLQKAGYSSRHGFAVSGYDFTVWGINALAEEYLRQLPEVERLRYTASIDRELRDRINQMRTAEIERATRYTDILREFYASEIVAARLGEDLEEGIIDQFCDAIEEQSKAHSISRCDMYLLLWIVHFITASSDSKAQRQRPLPKYSHVMVDEAQYYHPMVLRLFETLAQLPNGTMTIVGDLEQNIESRRWIESWDDIGLDFAPENKHRLVTNYRWSRRVFEFLQHFQSATGITEPLKAPIDWYSGTGRRPSIRKCVERSEELEVVAESICQLRDQHESELWTIAVVVPKSAHSAANPLVKLLTSYGVHARPASGEDVKESIDRVIVTDFDSIVGLEFDAVYVIAADQAIPQLTPENVRSLWVALTRARKFLHVSRINSDAVFDQATFAPYHE